MNDGILPKVLIFMQWFTPGYKAGGPTRAIQNFVDLLAHKFQIYIVTSDRDLGDTRAYSNVLLNTWISHPTGYSIIYLDAHHQSRYFLKEIIDKIKPDAIYLNSMFAYRFSILPLIIASAGRYNGKIVLAPRGMLKPSALKFGKVKKSLFLVLLKNIGFFKQVYFQATDEQELDEIRNQLNIRRDHIALIHDPPYIHERANGIQKSRGILNLIFVGRIHPIKGLDFLLDILKNLKFNIKLEIVGWIENKSFYKSCLEKIKLLPHNIIVEFKGNLPFEEAMVRISENHFMILPTHGENFGHAIFESLSAGRPVIISDQTPWRKLEEKGIGWDIPLCQPDKFEEVIEQVSAMNQEEYDQWSKRAFDFSKKYIAGTNIKEKYLTLFGAPGMTPQ